MSDSEFPSWMFKSKNWSTCTFGGLEPKKQTYLNSLTEEMTKKGFQLVKEIKIDTQWESFLHKKSDLMFKSPDGKVRIGVQAAPKDKDLRVGFKDVRLTKKKFRFLFIFSILFAWILSALSAYITRNTPNWTTFIPIIVFCLSFIAPIILYIGMPARSWRQQVKALLVKTAESMGGKQITPFKKTTVELEG